MSKEVEGYYEGDDPTKPDHPTADVLFNALDVIFDTIQSHDGWYCPHCREKSNVYDEEMENNRYMELLHEYKPMLMRCAYCHKEYYLRCYMTVKFSTCVDEKFDDE